MKTRLFTAEDHPVVLGWWAARGWPEIPMDHLSSFGMIAEDEVLLAAAWLYITNSVWAWIEFVVTNPEAPLKARHTGVELVLSTLRSEAAAMGKKSIITSVSPTQRGLRRIYERVGFVVTDQNQINMVARLG